MPDTLNIGSSKAVLVTADNNNRKTVLNHGGTIYYGAETVSSSSNDGNVTDGSSVTLSQSKHFISASSSQLVISDVSDETLPGNQVVGGNLTVTGTTTATGTATYAGLVRANSLRVTTDLVSYVPAGTRSYGNFLIDGDANAAYTVLGSGETRWGAGGATAYDTNLYRRIANTLKTDDALEIAGTTTPQGGIVPVSPFARVHTVEPTSLTYGTDTTPVATETYFAEILLTANATLTGVKILVGSVGGTNSAVVALYDSAGVVVANSALAGTTVGTTATWQSIAFTSTYAAKGPAQYFVGLQVNGTTARFRSIPAGPQIATGKKTGEVFGTLTTITAPTTFTADLGPVAATY